MPYVRVWVHLNWSTKRAKRLISRKLKSRLLADILENARAKGIYIDTMNCVEDHIHVLLSLGANQSLSKVLQLIKGESSHWVNESGLIDEAFEWQDDFFGISVSESVVPVVREYIRRQEEHHRRRTYGEEYRELSNGDIPPT